MTTFAEIVDATGGLTSDQKQELVEILQRRIRDENRRQLRAEADAARAEHAAGESWVATPEEIINEVHREA